MKKLMVAALLAGQLATAAQPVLAAELTDTRQQAGAFAGLRLRMPLDGNVEQRRLRAGLALAPTLHTQTAGGETRLQFGEGVELGLVGREPVQLSIGGTPVSRLAQGGDGPDGQRLGVSTIGWIAIGVGALAIATVVLFESCRAGDICGSDRDS